MHPPNKENMFPPNMEKTCSLVHGVPTWGPNISQHFPPSVGAAPHHGGPSTPLSSHKALPPQGGAPQTSPKTAPTNRGILSPHAGTRCFLRLFLLKNFERSQNISGTL